MLEGYVLSAGANGLVIRPTKGPDETLARHWDLSPIMADVDQGVSDFKGSWILPDGSVLYVGSVVSYRVVTSPLGNFPAATDIKLKDRVEISVPFQLPPTL